MTTDRSRLDRRPSYQDLDLAQCFELLPLHSTGRVAWTAADGPQLFPVSYVWLDELIIFRTSPYGVLSELVRRTDVVFEVDDVDQERRVAWSVIVHGRAEGIAAPDRLGDPDTAAWPLPWAGGHRNLFIGITPRTVTGRRFDRAAIHAPPGNGTAPP